MELDDSDKRILPALQAQPDLTMRELADVIGLSHSPCWQRLQRLQTEGAVTPRRFVIDPETVGYEVLAFCFVKISHHQRDRLAEPPKTIEPSLGLTSVHCWCLLAVKPDRQGKDAPDTRGTMRPVPRHAAPSAGPVPRGLTIGSGF